MLFMNSGSVVLSWHALGDLLLEPRAGVIDDLDCTHGSGKNCCWGLRKGGFSQVALQEEQWKHSLFFQKQNKESL